MDASEVMPNAAAPAPAPAVTSAPPIPEGNQPDKAPPPMPPALLKIPAFSGLLTGKPGAFSLPIKESKNRADLQDFAKYKDWLGRAGMYVYSALDGKTGVVANALYIHPEELKAADAAGQLHQIAPPFDAVNHTIGKSGTAHPALDTNHKIPVGLKGPPVPQPPVAASAAPPAPNLPPPPASAQRKVLTAQVNNMQPGGPTSGPAPGAGNLLRNILRPVV